MIKYLIRSLALGALTILGILLLIFLLMHAAPGDPINTIAPNAPLEVKEQIKKELGLDRPVFIQFTKWIWKVLQGDLGRSYRSGGIPVSTLLKTHIPPTILLVLSSYFVSLIIAIPLGVYMGLPDKKVNRSIFDMIFDLLGAIPDFWMARMLIVFLALSFAFIPVSYTQPIGFENLPFWDKFAITLKNLLLPSIALGLGSGRVTLFARHTREEIRNAFSNNYMEFAISKGIGVNRAIWTHAVPNTLIPLLSYIVSSVPTFIGATIVIEKIFTYPGLGILIYNSCIHRNYPVILGSTLVLAVTVTILNFIHDIIHYSLDPRARH